MGILDFAEEAAGAFGADKALEAVDPNAGILAKGAAAIAGFEGVSKLKEHFAEGAEAKTNADGTEADADDASPSDDASG